MKKISLIILIIFFTQQLSFSQIPSWQWAKTIGGMKDDYCRSIACDSKSNVVMVGDFLSDSITSGSIHVQNIHPLGGILNQYSLSDIFVNKYDSSGNILWSKSFGGDSSDIVSSVTIDLADNIIVVGKFNGHTLHIGNVTLTKPLGQTAPDAFVFKLDPNGNVLWAKNTSGSSVEEGKAVTTDEDNNIYMAGQFWGSNVNFGANIFSSVGNDDIFITKYSSNGTALWTKTYGSVLSESVMDICADKKGHIYFTGEYRSSNLTIGTLLPPNIDSSPSTEIYVAKMDLNGNIVWNQTANSISGDYVYGICTDKQKNVIITGSFSEYYLHIDSNVFAGDHITNPNCTSGTGLFVIKFDSLGLFKWYQTISISFDEVGLSVKTDKDDNIYVAAFARGDSLLIDTMMLYGLTNSASLLLKYDPNGHIIWYKKFGDGDHVGTENVGMDIDISSQGSLYMGSSFMKPTYTIDNLNCNNTNNSLVFEPLIAKLGSFSNQSLGTKDHVDEYTCSIYPNPTSGNMHVLVNDHNLSYNINIYNIQGQTIKKLNRQKGHVTIEVHDIPSGIYFIELSNQQWSKTSRVLVQH